MSNSQSSVRLREVLAFLYPLEGDIYRIVMDADINASKIKFNDKPINIWHNVLLQAQREDKLEQLKEVTTKDYERNKELSAAWSNYISNPPGPLQPTFRAVIITISISVGIPLLLFFLKYNGMPSSNTTSLPTREDPATFTSTPVATFTVSNIPQPSLPEAKLTINSEEVNIRQGPSTNCLSVNTAKQGESYKIMGINRERDWWQIDIDESQPGHQSGWVYTKLVSVQNVTDVQVITDVPACSNQEIPTPTLSPTATPLPVTDGATSIKPIDTLTDTPTSTPTSTPQPSITIAEIDIGSGDAVYVWFTNETVSSGTTADLMAHRTPYPYTLPSGESPTDIVGIAIGSGDAVYVWFADGTVSSGTTADLMAHRTPYPYTLPPGKSPTDIVGIAIGSGDAVYVWFADGTVGSGTTADLMAHRTPYPYTLPPGKSPTDIVGIAIGSGDAVYAWFADGTVSSGTTSDLMAHRTPYPYTH